MDDFGKNLEDAYSRGRIETREAIETGEISPEHARKIVTASFATTFWVGAGTLVWLIAGLHWALLGAAAVALAIWLPGGVVYGLAQGWLIGVIHRAKARAARNSN